MTKTATAPITAPVLTDRQQEVVDYLKSSLAERGFCPSVREIGDKLGINSPNGVMVHLKALERKGAIKRTERIARAIKVLV